MMALWMIFLVLMAISFATMVALLRPSRRDGEMDVRLQAVLLPTVQQGAAEGSLTEPSAKVIRPFDWLERMLHGTALLRRVETLRLQVQSRWSAGGTIFSSVLAGVLGTMLCYAGAGSVPLAAVGCCAAGLPCLLLKMERARRLKAFDDALPGAMEMCARSLRAGHSVANSFALLAQEAAEPARTEFAEVFRKQNYGLPLRECLTEMLHRVPSADLAIFVTGILVQKDTGGNLPEIMDRMVSVIRDRARVKAEVRTHTAQGRLTGWILCVLPPLLLLLTNLINPGYSAPLLRDGVGKDMLYAGLGLLALGAFLIHRIIQGVEV